MKFLAASFLIVAAIWPPHTARAESYSYDEAGRLIQVVYPDGQILRYAYDENSNILSVGVVSDEIFSNGFEK